MADEFDSLDSLNPDETFDEQATTDIPQPTLAEQMFMRDKQAEQGVQALSYPSTAANAEAAFSQPPAAPVDDLTPSWFGTPAPTGDQRMERLWGLDNAQQDSAQQASVPQLERLWNADTQAPVQAPVQDPNTFTSPDYKENFRSFLRANPQTFDRIQTGVNIDDPEASAQFNRAQFWARVQARPGGYEAFDKLSNTNKNAVIRSFVVDRMREIYPGYGRGQKLPPGASTMEKELYNQMRDASTLDVNGATRAPSLIGATAEDTMRNVLRSPDLDQRLLDDLPAADRAKYLRAFLGSKIPDPETRRQVEFQMAPLLLDPDGARYDELTQPDRAVAPAPTFTQKVKEAVSTSNAISNARYYTTDVLAGAAGSLARIPGDIASGIDTLSRTAPRYSPFDLLGLSAMTPELEAKIYKQTNGGALRRFSTWWSEKVGDAVSAVSTEARLAARRQTGERQEQAIEDMSVKDFFSAMKDDPVTSVEQLAGIVGNALSLARLGSRAGGAVARRTGAAAGEVGEVSEAVLRKAGAAGATAAAASGQVTSSVLSSSLPPRGTPAYDRAAAAYGESALSKARRAEADEKGYEYDLQADFEGFERDKAATAGAWAGLITLGSAMSASSIEQIVAGKVGAASTVAGKASAAGKTGLVEGISEGLENYASAVSESYYNKVRDEFATTGFFDKLIQASQDGKAAVQAGIGFIMGGAAGVGFGVMHNVMHGRIDKANEIIDQVEAAQDTQAAPDTQAAQDAQAAQATPDTQAAQAAQAAQDTWSTPPRQPSAASAQSEADMFSAMAAEEALRRPAGTLLQSEAALMAQAEQAAQDTQATQSSAIIDADSELSAAVTARNSLESQFRAAEKKATGAQRTPADIRTRNDLEQQLAAANADVAARQLALDTATATTRDVPVEVRRENGTPTGVKMDRVAFDSLRTAQTANEAAVDTQQTRANTLTASLVNPATRIVELDNQKASLATVMRNEQKTQYSAAVDAAQQTMDKYRKKIAEEEGIIKGLKREKRKETLASDTYRRTLRNAESRLKTAQNGLSKATEARDEADANLVRLGKRNKDIENSDEFKSRMNDIDAAIAEQNDVAKLIKSQADDARGAADKIRSDFENETGFASNEVYTNRQAGLAERPITDESLQRVLGSVDDAIRVGESPVTVVVLRTPADFALAEEAFGELPNTKFATMARRTKAGDVLLVNQKRVEDADADTLMRDLVSKAAVTFTLNNLAQTHDEYATLLANIARSAVRTREGRQIANEVSSEYAATGVDPSQRAYNASFVAKLLRSGTDSTVSLRPTFRQRAATAIRNLIVRRFPKLARGLGLGNTIADIGTINDLFSRIDMTSTHLPDYVDGDWASLKKSLGVPDRQRRTFVNTRRYESGLGLVMQTMADRAAFNLAIDAVESKLDRGVLDLPEGTTEAAARQAIRSARVSLESRVRRTDNRVRNEALPLYDAFNTALRDGARMAGDTVADFQQYFDRWVQLRSIAEMVSPGGDYYLQKIKLGDDGKALVRERLAQLELDQKAARTVAARAALGRAARRDVEAIATAVLAGEQKRVMYAGFDAESVRQELASIEQGNPGRQAAFALVDTVFKDIMRKVTDLKIESSEWDPMEIAFRGRENFVFRGGKDIDASTTAEDSDILGRSIGARKSISAADEAIAAKGRSDLPRNATVQGLVELIDSVRDAEMSRTMRDIDIITKLDPTLVVAKESAPPTDWSSPTVPARDNFDFNYFFSASKGSTKAVQFMTNDGLRARTTFANEDVIDALRIHSVIGERMKMMAHAQGLFGSLYTTRNPAFVVGRQAPRDFMHNLIQLIVPRYGVAAGGRFVKAVGALSPRVARYAALPGKDRDAAIAALPANDPLRRYVENGGWFGAHAQHAATDIAASFRETGLRERLLSTVPGVNALLNTLPEAADNLFRMAYFDAVTSGRDSGVTDAEAVVESAQIMDISSGSRAQRAMSPWVPFARSFVNSINNIMFRDLWQHGRMPTREIFTPNGRKVTIDWARVPKDSTLHVAAPLMILSAMGIYGLARAMAGAGEPPPTPDEISTGLILPGGGTVAYQFGLNRVFGAAGGLAAALMNGDITETQGAQAMANVMLKELQPLGIQVVDGNQVSAMLAQVMGSNAFTKFFVPFGKTDIYGRPISREYGKPSTPDAYRYLSADDPDLAAYYARQFGYLSTLFDAGMREMSTNQSDEQLSRSRGRITGLSSFVIGGYGGMEKVRGQREELITSYESKLKKAKRTRDTSDERDLRRSTPGARSIEAYITLDNRLRREYSETRKRYEGRPDFGNRMRALNERQNRVRERALAAVRRRTS